MGVTIHFEGQLTSEKSFDELITVVVRFAEVNRMPYSFFAEESKLLQRVRNEEEWDYQGPVKGIWIQPDDKADPLWLEFDENLYVQDFCKTQFAGPDTHIQIIGLLEELEKFFVELVVFDEGEYWGSHNREELAKHLENCFKAMEQRLTELPKVTGPYRMEDGRMIDLLGE